MSKPFFGVFLALFATSALADAYSRRVAWQRHAAGNYIFKP